MSNANKTDSSLSSKEDKPNLLLHICCAPCATYVIELLRGDFDLTAFFYNPNIQPEAEYNRRRDEVRRLAALMGFKLICLDQGQEEWLEKVRGWEDEPEGGYRCQICYKFRLEKSAQYAKEEGFCWYASTLSISPHKQAKVINKIGRGLGEKHEINFFQADFKKRDGFKKSCELSNKYELYRQDYCGCLFSLRSEDKEKLS